MRLLVAAALLGGLALSGTPATALPCIGPAHICLPTIDCPAWDCFPPPGR